MSDYGYRKRAPMPDRPISAPMQAQPRSAWPRKLADAVKNPGDTGSLFAIQTLLQSDNTSTAYIGLAVASTSEGGPGSTTVTAATWWADIARFCRYVEINASGTNNKRLNRTALTVNISPLALLDPSQPIAPWINWFEDICAARLSSPSAGHEGAFHFGLTWENATGVALAAPQPFIGIYANWSDTAYGTWRARCVDDSGNGLDESLGISTELPHRLAYGIDGTGVVHFQIDGEELYTYQTTGSDLATHTIFAITHRWTTAADNGGTIKAGYFMDMQTVVSVEVLEETGD